jgi:uncharacterized phage protein (TIGR01671 family)
MIQREIKYRAFDDGKMIYQHQINITNNFDQLSHFFKTIREDAIVMEFTGLNDKNNKEIYEGDIVEKKWLDQEKNGYIEYFIKGVIEYHKNCFIIKGLTYGSYVNDEFKDPFWHEHYKSKSKKNDRIYTEFEQFEVIGNIYENKELLN